MSRFLWHRPPPKLPEHREVGGEGVSRRGTKGNAEFKDLRAMRCCLAKAMPGGASLGGSAPHRAEGGDGPGAFFRADVVALGVSQHI